MRPDIAVRTDFGLFFILLAAALAVFAVIVLVKLIAKPTFAKFALLGFLGMVMFGGVFALLLGTTTVHHQAVGRQLEYPPYVANLDELRNAQQEFQAKREEQRVAHLEKLAEQKAELSAALAEVKAAREEAQQQIQKAQLQAKNAPLVSAR